MKPAFSKTEAPSCDWNHVVLKNLRTTHSTKEMCMGICTWRQSRVIALVRMAPFSDRHRTTLVYHYTRYGTIQTNFSMSTLPQLVTQKFSKNPSTWCCKLVLDNNYSNVGTRLAPLTKFSLDRQTCLLVNRNRAKAMSVYFLLSWAAAIIQGTIPYGTTQDGAPAEAIALYLA